MTLKRTFAGRGKTALLAVAVVGALLFLSPAALHLASAARDTYGQLEVFANTLSIIRKNYVEDVSNEHLIEGAIEGMMRSLDPHSAYLTPELYKELQVDTRGTFGGLGIEITLRDDVLTIITPLEDTPASRVGVEPGDQIIKIGDTVTKGMPLMKAVSLLRGPKGTEVVLTLRRKDLPEMIEVAIKREIINVRSVKGSKLYNGRYGYVRVVQFQEGTAAELETVLAQLDEEAGGVMQGLVLDLRRNPGGLLNQAVKVSDLFIDAGLIVYTDGRIDTQKQRFLAHDEGTRPDVPMVVLVDGGSASASEIVAGAMQDHDRAVVLGTQTFGKGSVQTILPLDSASALRLTTARYYTPSGRSIQATGITPDVVVEPTVVLARASGDSPGVRESDLPAHMENEQGVSDLSAGGQLGDDPQLERALDLLKTWKVFSRYQTSGADMREPLPAAVPTPSGD